MRVAKNIGSSQRKTSRRACGTGRRSTPMSIGPMPRGASRLFYYGSHMARNWPMFLATTSIFRRGAMWSSSRTGEDGLRQRGNTIRSSMKPRTATIQSSGPRRCRTRTAWSGLRASRISARPSISSRRRGRRISNVLSPYPPAPITIKAGSTTPVEPSLWAGRCPMRSSSLATLLTVKASRSNSGRRCDPICCVPLISGIRFHRRPICACRSCIGPTCLKRWRRICAII